jgi:hypothetical protein
MGSYNFERSPDWEGQASSSALAADVERALGELDWVDDFTVRADAGDGGVVVADVAFDPDWPDTANPDLVAETLVRYGLHIIDAGTAAGRVSAADPLRASDSVDDGGMDLFVFDEE